MSDDIDDWNDAAWAAQDNDEQWQYEQQTREHYMQPPPIIKFCINCKYYEAAPGGMELSEFSRCNYRFPDSANLVTGEPARQPYRYCTECRSKDYLGLCCGPDALFFEPRPTMFAQKEPTT